MTRRRQPQEFSLLRVLAFVAVGSLVALPGCSRERATEESCNQILDRIVELELHEKGFRDPALTERRRRELRHSLAPELKQCIGKRLRPNALACIQQASTAEDLSHRCLR